MGSGWEWLGINDEDGQRLNEVLTGSKPEIMQDGPAKGVETIVPNIALKIRVTLKPRIHNYERREDGLFWYTGESFPRVYCQVF